MLKWLGLGAFVGAALGLLSSSIDILIWSSRGRPPVLVRQGWEMAHIAVTVFGGLGAGLVYGAILGDVIDSQRWRKNAIFLLPLTFFVASALYVVGAVTTVKILHIGPWLCTHAVVFVVALIIARLGLGRSAGRTKAAP